MEIEVPQIKKNTGRHKGRRKSHGFTLVEMMIALALGLVMIGAAIVVFLSNQQSAQINQEMNRAQEAFRFASHTIMRVVQQGEIQDPRSVAGHMPGVNVLLVVEVTPEPGHRDCFGRLISTDADTQYATISFFIEDGDLRCHVDSAVDEYPQTLVSGLDAARTEIRFGASDDDEEEEGGFWNDNSKWVPASGIEDEYWSNVRSIRVRLTMQSENQAIGPAAVFSATMRCGALDIC